MSLKDSVKKILKNLNPFKCKDAKEIIEKLLENKTSIAKGIRDKDIQDGSILYFEYNPKDTSVIYDFKPLIIVFGISRGYVLGLNFHWIEMESRKELVEYIININTKNKKIQVPLEFHYEDFKPLLKNPVFKRSVRLYIRKRMSLNGVVIDPKYLLDTVRLKLEHFVD